jgi:hypothetical protein
LDSLVEADGDDALVVVPPATGPEQPQTKRTTAHAVQSMVAMRPKENGRDKKKDLPDEFRRTWMVLAHVRTVGRTAVRMAQARGASVALPFEQASQ